MKESVRKKERRSIKQWGRTKKRKKDSERKERSESSRVETLGEGGSVQCEHLPLRDPSVESAVHLVTAILATTTGITITIICTTAATTTAVATIIATTATITTTTTAYTRTTTPAFLLTKEMGATEEIQVSALVVLFVHKNLLSGCW